MAETDDAMTGFNRKRVSCVREQDAPASRHVACNSVRAEGRTHERSQAVTHRHRISRDRRLERLLAQRP
jgi:hypothetical protein